MVHNTNTANAEKAAVINVTAITSAINAAEAEAVKKAEALATATAKAKEAKKAAKAASKEAEKAAAKAAKPEASKEAKTEAKAKEKAAKKAAEAVTKAEAVETAAAASKAEALAAIKVAKAAETAAAGTLTIKAEAERKGLNAAVRALLESAKEATPAEAAALLAFVGRPLVSDSKAVAAAAEVTKGEVIAAYRTFSTYAVTDGSTKQVARAVRLASGANAFTFEPSTLFNIMAIFRQPSANKRSGRRQFMAEAGKYYEAVKNGAYTEITKAEALARQKAAEEAAAAEADRKSKAEAQAEDDRKRGEAVRLAEAKAEKVATAKAATASRAKAEEAAAVIA